jgi:hypothetical protein
MSEHIKTDIPAYLNGDLTESRQRHIESHAAGCDECRSALNKARAKMARGKRQALKKANPDPLPNLLLSRLGKQIDLNYPSRPGTWKWFLLLILIGGAAYFVKRHLKTMDIPIGTTAESDVALSSSTPSNIPSGLPVDMTTSTAVVTAPVVAPTPTPAAAEPAAEPVHKTVPDVPEPPQTWSGEDSSVHDLREVVINGRRSWRALWSEMGHDSPAPVINFVDTMVVGVFAGEQPNGDYRVLLQAPKTIDEEVQVPYRITTVATSTAPVTNVMHPYALTTLPRVPKAVHLVRQPG